MQACQQTKGQSVYRHGLAVRDHTLQLVAYLRGEPLQGAWLLPEWIKQYREQLLSALAPIEIIEEYTTYHDCGKPYCQANETTRFPEHSEVSCRTWLDVGGSPEAARLMRLDMMIHTLKAEGIDAFCALPEAPTLLISGLSEIHANSEMFGGLDSTSFKIKWKHIDRRGRAICAKIFGGCHGL